MRIGATYPVEIEDLTFHLLRERGPKRRYQKAVLDVDLDVEKQSVGVQARTGLSLQDLSDALLCETIVSVDGLEDENGKPLAWVSTPDMLNKLPDGICDELVKIIMPPPVTPESEEGNANSGSPSPPDSTSEGEV